MREDFEHKFNERRGTKYPDKYPRGNKRLKFQNKEGDDGPKREGMAKAHRVADHFRNYDSHNWGIVRRMLRKYAGRPWDEVFSEICEATDGRTHEGHEIRWWIESIYVETRCQMIDGKVYNDRGLSVVNHWGCCEEFYVHPETGLLCMSEFKPWRSKEPEEVRPKILENDDTLYHQHEGIWYRVKLQPWIKEKLYDYNSRRSWIGMRSSRIRRDVFIGKGRWESSNSWRATNAAETKYGKDANGDLRICIWKQAANGKEIAKLKRKYQWD